MTIRNADVAAAFDEIADLLEIQGANPFRVRAYRNASRVVGSLERDVAALVDANGDLAALPGIGKDLAAKIEELVRTGKLRALAELRRKTPRALVTLLRVPGLGPRKVKRLHEELGVRSVAGLKRAAAAGRVARLPGFGAKSAEKILSAIDTLSRTTSRTLLAVAAQYAEPLADYMARAPGALRVAVAGSYRRRQETVGDIDILVAAVDGARVADHFVAYEDVQEIRAHGPTRSAIVLRSGLAVDLRVVPPRSFGAALHYFTGSKAHNIAVRQLGLARGLKVNEYGVFSGSRQIAGETEESVYRSVGLPYIEPELREDRGELEAARAGELPPLVEWEDVRGDLHCHTRASDGRNSLEELAAAAKARGYAYLAITDHSKSIAIAHGLSADRLSRQCDAIDALNERLTGIRLLKGVEVEVLEDGRLDLPTAVLARLDIVVAAIHGHFGLPRGKQTTRLMKAIDHPAVNVISHPTCRLLGGREPLDLDFAAVLRHASSAGCALEVNGQPERMDLDDVHCRMVKQAGVRVSLGSDAHLDSQLDLLRCALGQARRGWLEKRDVLNTRSLRDLRRILQRN